MHTDLTEPGAEPAARLRAMFSEQPDRLRRRAVSLGLRHEDAEDIAQSVAVAALEHVDDVRSSDEPVICAWVDTIARRIVTDEYRRRERERRFVGEVERDASGEADGIIAAIADSAEAEWERRASLVATATAIRALPAPLREVVDLRYGDELPTRRIAERLGLSDAAVRQRLTRARSMLTEQVGSSV